MRDIILLFALPFLIYAASKRPFIAIGLWLWSALVPPHIWSFGGLATSIRWNFLFAIITIVGLLLSKIDKSIPKSSIFILGCLFFAHTTITSIVNAGDGFSVWDRWDFFMRVFLLFFMMVIIVKKKLHFDTIAWAIVLSFSYQAFIEGAKFLSSGGGHVIYGLSPGFNDNNLSALATLMCVPFILYLIQMYPNEKKVRYCLLGLLFFNLLFILGSDSRGAFVGLLILSLYYFMKTRHKIRTGIAIAVFCAASVGLLSEEWFERMETIQTANEDSSFMGRVKSWKIATLMAMESPIFGGGFNAAFSNRETINRLISNWDAVSFIPSSPLYIGDKVYVAHSIYFQVLADHGFFGLFIYGLIALVSYLTLSNIIKKSQIDWQINLAEKLRLSLFVFLVSGSLLSSAYNDLIWAIFALTVALRASQERYQLSKSSRGFTQ